MKYSYIVGIIKAFNYNLDIFKIEFSCNKLSRKKSIWRSSVCPKSLGQINIVSYCINWVKTSLTYSIQVRFHDSGRIRILLSGGSDLDLVNFHLDLNSGEYHQYKTRQNISANHFFYLQSPNLHACVLIIKLLFYIFLLFSSSQIKEKKKKSRNVMYNVCMTAGKITSPVLAKLSMQSLQTKFNTFLYGRFSNPYFKKL